MVDHQFEEMKDDVRELTKILNKMSDPIVPLLELLQSRQTNALLANLVWTFGRGMEGRHLR